MTVGEVVGPFGVKGELKVALLTDFPERFRGLHRVYLGPERKDFQVIGSRLHKDRVLLHLDGVETPEEAMKLRGLEIAVPRDDAVPLPPGHFYLDDLVGCHVTAADGRSIGEVSQVLRTGSNDVLVIGEGRAELLIPITKDAIRDLDLVARRIVVELWVLDVPE